MNYCILRIKKLSSFGSIAGSIKHTFREIATPNANASRTHLNWTSGAQTSAKVCATIMATLPAERRKDAVLCIEYLIRASPGWFEAGWRESGSMDLNGKPLDLSGRSGYSSITADLSGMSARAKVFAGLNRGAGWVPAP